MIKSNSFGLDLGGYTGPSLELRSLMKKCFLGALLNPRKVKTTVLTLVIVNAWTVEIGQYYTDYSTALDDMNMMNEISPRRLIEYDRTVSKVTNIHAWTGPTVSTDRLRIHEP